VARSSTGASPAADPQVHVGRRVFLGIVALGAIGVAVGAKVQSGLSGVVGSSGLGGLLPGGDHFRIYSITGTLPEISDDQYRLEVSGLVRRPTTLTLDDLRALPRTTLVRDFHCVTGWVVPDVHWEGVRLSAILDAVGVLPSAQALSFDSYDGLDTESLTLDQARLPDVIVADKMLGGPVTTEHGGPVRLYVAPMFGYKSIKWLSAIRVVDQVEPGYWEQNGYPVNGWIDGSTGPTDPGAD
jgi:DMSO/TMAO reductase YedYZ molybdopterin-dependent catalytic subunit